MLKNYLKIAFRNLWKRKLFSGINILGMAVAIACSLLLFLTAFHEFSYDRFHKNGKHIYRVYQEEFRTQGVKVSSNMPTPMQPALLEEIPELAHAVRWLGGGVSVEQEGQIFRQGIRFTDPDFFEMFSFPLIEGNAVQVLADLNSAVVTEKVAKQVFGTTDVVGETIKVVINGVPRNLVISGIVEDTPVNSTLHLSIITRFENHPEYNRNKERWDNYNHDLYVQLPDNLSKKRFEDRAGVIVEKYYQDEVERLMRDGATPDADGQVIRFRLQPLKDWHFDQNVSGSGISKAFPIGLFVIAGFILIIACINFVNLNLGSSLTRAKEVGIRKVLGALKRQLVAQFWGEALLVIIIALAVGLTVAQWLLPEYNALFKQSLSLNNPNLIGAILLVLVVAGLIGGAYPSMVLSRFQAAEVLKRNTAMQKPGKLRNILVLVQFTLAVLLISCTIIVSQQLNYLRNKPLGFNESQVLSLPISSELDSRKVLERMRNELAAFPNIEDMTATYNNIGMGKDGSRMTSIVGFEQGELGMLSTHWNQVDYNYLETMEIPIVEGRSFSVDHSTDSTEAIIINETFARQLNDSSALGMVLDLEPPRKVIGVMKDYHFRSLTNPMEPLSLVLGDGDGFRFNYLFIRIAGENIPETLAQLEKSWKELHPQSAFIASFLDENAGRQYESEAVLGKIFMGAALLAIILSCMGLFGIAVLVIGQRTKEIGIRKVLGASVRNIVQLISKEFMLLVMAAILIASPLAWIGMNKWLNNYAYSIKIHWWVFLLAGLLAMVIAFVTLSLQSVKAAMMNPAKTLKTE